MQVSPFNEGSLCCEDGQTVDSVSSSALPSSVLVVTAPLVTVASICVLELLLLLFLKVSQRNFFCKVSERAECPFDRLLSALS